MIDGPVHPEAARRVAERNELIRRAAASVVADHDAGRVVDPETLTWARQIAATFKPLPRPLGPGATDESKRA